MTTSHSLLLVCGSERRLACFHQAGKDGL